MPFGGELKFILSINFNFCLNRNLSLILKEIPFGGSLGFYLLF